MKACYILGISCFYHDSGAALLRNGTLVGAAQEERFSRIKHDSSFPLQSIQYLLNEAKIGLPEIEAIIYYEKPFITFERLLETHLYNAPWGFKLFATSIPVWIKEKLFLEREIKKHLKKIDPTHNPLIKYSEHHLSHAASAFYPSPYKNAAIVCVDGVGEWATTSVWVGNENQILPVCETHFPHSLGLLYSTITAYLGFKVNSGEYKVMGLAPYGKPVYFEKMMANLIDLHDDGSYSLNMKYFTYGSKIRMFDKSLEEFFGQKAREPESQLTDFHMNVASSVQAVLEKAMIHLISAVKRKTSEINLCLAGGVALNCVANSKILNEAGFDNIWIQPAAGDAGGAIGAALGYWHLGLKNSREIEPSDALMGSYLGPSYEAIEIKYYLEKNNIPYEELNLETRDIKTCELLEAGKIIGWFQGRMEFGPRALGHRSILGDARIKDMQHRMNLKVKFRESFRPFAPIVLEEDVGKIFKFKGVSPYMLFVADVNDDLREKISPADEQKFGIERLNQIRSKYPAITHVDYSARLQTVSRNRSPILHSLLTKYKERNLTSVLVNTSFNVRGEPIVCTPQDAFKCFMRTDIDALILGNFLITKDLNSHFTDELDWRKSYELD